MCGASHASTLKYVLLVCFSSPSQSYSGVWWCAMSSIHFSVPAIFVLFVYLDVFLWLNFISMNILVFWDLGINTDTVKFYFLLQNFMKKKYGQYNSCALLFGTSITLLQLIIFLWSFFHLSMDIHWYFRKKVILIFGVHIRYHFKMLH